MKKVSKQYEIKEHANTVFYTYDHLWFESHRLPGLCGLSHTDLTHSWTRRVGLLMVPCKHYVALSVPWLIPSLCLKNRKLMYRFIPRPPCPHEAFCPHCAHPDLASQWCGCVHVLGTCHVQPCISVQLFAVVMIISHGSSQVS